MAKQSNMKRIHKVTVKRMCDESPDTSWLGEYADRATSEFSIDRAHDLDCPQQTFNEPTDAKDAIQHAMDHLTAHTYGKLTERETIDAMDANDILIGAQNELEEDCSCGSGGNWNNREYRYFNPGSVEPFKADASWIPATENDKRAYWLKTMRENARQDYERMESLSSGQFCFIGIRADAELNIPGGKLAFISQEITSGGLWGIESDSEASYIESIEQEELADLRGQLHAIGFSQRAITAAFKNVEHGGDAR